MKYLVFFISVLVVVGVQIGAFPHIKILDVAPNLLLLLVMIMALQKDEDALPIALLGGLFLDSYTGVFIGSFTISFLIVALVWYLFASQIMLNELDWKYVGVGLIFALAVNSFILWGYNALTFHFGWSLYPLDGSALRKKFPAELVYNLLLLYPMYEYVQWTRWLANYQERKRRLL